MILAQIFKKNFNEFLDQILCHNFGPQLNRIFRQNLVQSEKSLDNLSDHFRLNLAYIVAEDIDQILGLIFYYFCQIQSAESKQLCSNCLG